MTCATSRDSVHTLVVISSTEDFRLDFTLLIFSVFTIFWQSLLLVYCALFVSDHFVTFYRLPSDTTHVNHMFYVYVLLVLRAKMACSPNSGSVTISTHETNLVTLPPNSGLHHDFIGNSANYRSNVTVSGDVKLPAYGDDEALVTEAIVENIDNCHRQTSLPASQPATCSICAGAFYWHCFPGRIYCGTEP